MNRTKGGNQDGAKDDRQERLAAALRENLRRRKAQARAIPPEAGDAPPPEPDDITR